MCVCVLAYIKYEYCVCVCVHVSDILFLLCGSYLVSVRFASDLFEMEHHLPYLIEHAAICVNHLVMVCMSVCMYVCDLELRM